MGGSGWDYRVPFRTRIEDALIALQERVLASGDYQWDDQERGARPQSREQLLQLKAAEESWRRGTHSILDIDRLVPPEAADHDGTLRPLSWPEIRELFGTEYPTQDDFAAAYQGGTGPAVGGIRGWSGRCTVLYDQDGPVEYVLWGVSGT